MTAPPAELARELERLADAAEARYGVPLIRVGLVPGGVIGSVGVAAQLRQVDGLRLRLWPKARTRVLVLAGRRARLGLTANGEPLLVRRRPPFPSAPEPELTTELLPGDPPAEVVGAFAAHFLVRAPGEAVGWVGRPGSFLVAALRRSELAAVGPGGPERPWSPESVIEAALSHLGRPYVWGGTGSRGMDCSGLVWRSFLSAGLVLPRNSRAQRLVGSRVRRADLRAGDLVAAISRGPARLSHVALALSGAEVVHACSELMAVRREPLSDFLERYRVVAVRRLPGAIASSG